MTSSSLSGYVYITGLPYMVWAAIFDLGLSLLSMFLQIIHFIWKVFGKARLSVCYITCHWNVDYDGVFTGT